jgi:hypothetical protein
MTDIEELKHQGYVISTDFIAQLEPEEKDRFANYIKSTFFRPGEMVKVSRETVGSAIKQLQSQDGDVRVLESLNATADKALQIEKVYFYNERDIRFKLVNSDILFDCRYFVDSRPTLNMYGLVILHDDRLFAVSIDGVSIDEKVPPKILAGYEIQGEVEIGFGGVLGVNNRAEFLHFLENEADTKNCVCGEFYISDEGMETWCLSATAWLSGADEKELQLATAFIDEMISTAPKPN